MTGQPAHTIRRSFRQCATKASSSGELIGGSLFDNLTLFSSN
jgi:hypothetical protein